MGYQTLGNFGGTAGKVNANKYAPFAVQFEDVNNPGSIKIKDLFTDKNAKSNTSATGNNVDKIMVWSAASGTYTTYFLYTGNIWVKDGDTTFTETTDTVVPGDCVFFKKASAKAGSGITSSGAVPAMADREITLAANKYNYIANPWPTSLKIADIKGLLTGARANTAAKASGNDVDKVMVWNNDSQSYDNYYLSNEITGNAFVKVGETEETKDSIAPGSGFFLKKASSKKGSIKFVKPF